MHFMVRHEPGTPGSTVEASAVVASHDGSVAERHPPPWVQHERGGPVEVVGFARSKRRDRSVEVEGNRLVIRAGDANRWLVRVRSVAELTVAVDLTVTPNGSPSGSTASDRPGRRL